MNRRVGGEDGNVSLVTIGFVIVLVMLCAVVVNASDAYLDRQELMNLADGAALTAADGLDESAFYGGRAVTLDPAEARRLVDDYVGGRGARVVGVDVAGDEVSVRLERRLDLVLVPSGWTSGTTVTASASAQLRQA